MARNTGKKKPSLMKGIVTAYLGFSLLVSGSMVTFVLGAVLLGLGVANIVNSVTGGAKKKDLEEIRSVKREKVIRPRASAPVSAQQNTVPPSRREKELEQLECLYSAGMYDKEEYIRKRRDILSGR